MSALAVRWLAGLLCTLAVAAGSYWAGDHNRNNAWLAKQAVVDRDAHAKYVAEVVRGDKAMGNLITEHQALQSNFQNLTEKFNGLSKRVPLVLVGGGSACATGPDSLGIGRLGKPRPQPEALDGRELSSGDGPRLTAGAVWMWNSALTGTDQPAGACGANDTTSAACAAATEATLDDAWANHRANAQTCAEDRLGHKSLIDFLNKRASTKP